MSLKLKPYLSPEATRPWPNFKLFKTSAHFHKKRKINKYCFKFYVETRISC